MNKKKTLWLCIVLVGAMLFSGCDELAGLLEGQENGEDPDGPSGSTDLSFYVSEDDGDDGNDGLSKDTPFKTLKVAFEAARDSADRKQIVVLSNLTQTGADADADALTGPSELITIKGKDGSEIITREVVANGGAGSVLVITGGAKIAFVNIKVNGMYDGGGSVFNRAIKIDDSEVTLGQGAVITGKLQGDSSGDYPGPTMPDPGIPDTKNGSGVFVTNSGKLTIEEGSMVTDCKGPVLPAGGGTGTLGAVYANNESNVLMKGGEIYNNQARRGGGVAVYGNATFTMMGGKIRNNEATDGGGIYAVIDQKTDTNMPTLTLVSGEIYGNETTNDGGGIYTVKTLAAFTIENGVVISENKAGEYGGGIAAVSTTTTTGDNTITMNGGEISKNEAANGGGVYIYAVKVSVSFTMNGGEISKNTATLNGGGVYLRPNISKATNPYTATFTLTDGVIYGSTSEKANIISGGSTSNGVAIYKKDGPSGYDHRTTVKTPKGAVSNDSARHWEDTFDKNYTP
jgi:predicted outer membrane repeat protein